MVYSRYFRDDTRHVLDNPFRCKECDSVFKDAVFTATYVTGLCAKCREERIPEYIPPVQQAKYLKLKEEKNEEDLF